MTSRYHFTEELRCRSIRRLEARQSQIEVARWMDLGRARYSGHPPNNTLNPLRTYQQILLDFPQDKLAILTLNCQRARQTDFNDVISENCTLLMFSETWLDNDERVSIPNFDYCVQFKRPSHKTAGVAIYLKQKNSHVATPHMDITYRPTSGLGIVSNVIGGHMCGRTLI
ncbi:uncharacterized protein TNCV_1413961 [Trichonephila clavipes]|nr:uncharacterized protein TNCV_1413961 [Trichonephila clavipes]